MRLIRKQKNRRLYDTKARRNITLAELATLIGAGDSVRVEDTASGEDITRNVLLQIVMEQESPSSALLSQTFLENLIRLYNNPLQTLVSGYLDASLTAFQQQQTDFLERWQQTVDLAAHPSLAEMAQQGPADLAQLQQAFFAAWTGAGRDDTDD